MQGWVFALDSGAAGTGQLVIGPGTPPAGSGSAQITVADAATGMFVGAGIYTNTLLANITALSYSTYRTSGGVAEAPALQFAYDQDNTDGITSWQGRLVYEPYLNGSPTAGNWQTWDAINGGNGLWWASNNGVSTVDNACPMAAPCTWSTIIATFPNIAIHPTIPQVLFKAGSGWASFDGNVDNFSITISGVTDTYNFEPALRVHNITQGTDYPTIQLAVNAADPNDIIEIDEGVFNENVTVDKALTLSGAGAGPNPAQHTIIDGTALAGRGILLTTNTTGVTIEGVRVQNFTGVNGAGIYATGGNSDFTVQNTDVMTNGVPGNATGGIYMNGPVDNILFDTILAQNNQTRGIVIWNGFKTNITITNSTVRNNNCCGIELQDGTSSAVTITNNTIENNGDSGLSVLGMRGGAGPNLIAGNTLINNGRFGMEIKNPNGTGLDNGDGSIVIENNTVSFSASVGMNNRDHGGILIMRRDFTPGNPTGYVNVPTGVVIRNNSVAGYDHMNQVAAPTESEGFGIVIEGTNHTVISNTLTSNNIGIQEQGGLHPVANYVENDAGSGSQNAGDSPAYFGRGNAPIACGNTIANNIFTTNGQNVRASIAPSSVGLVTNTDTGELFCSIQAAINDADTLAGHTIVASAGEYAETIDVTKPGLQVLGPNAGIDPNTAVRTAEAIIRPAALSITQTQYYNVSIEAGGVLFDGFTIDGDNLVVTTGVNINGANTDSEYLIYASNTDASGPVTITHNIVQNGLVNGFVGYTGGSAVSSGNVVANNLFDNINDGAADGRALAPRWNYYANLVDNVVTQSVIGVYNDNVHLPSAVADEMWMGNHIAAERAGIWYNLAYGTATDVTIVNNHITAEPSPFLRWDGVWLTSLGGAVNPIIQGNMITGTLAATQSNGYNLWNDTTSAPDGIAIEGGTVADVDYGVWVNNWDGYPTSTGSNAGASTVSISGMMIDNAALAAVYAKDNPLEPDGDPVDIAVHNLIISNTPVGVWVQGPDATATVKGSMLNTADTALSVSEGTLVAYANNITNFTTGITSTTPALLNGRHNWWGAIDPVGVNDADAVAYRLGAAVDTWGEDTLGAASLTSAGGTGTAVIVSHGRGLANVPFAKGVAPAADTMCSDYYDFFVLDAVGDWTVSVPVDNIAACDATLANGNLYHMALTGTAPDTACLSEACWLTPAGTAAAGQNITVTLDAAQFLVGTPFVAGENTPDYIPPTADVLLGPDQAQTGLPTATLTYTVAITNTGATTGTMLLTSASGWVINLPASVADLGAGQSTTFDVQVTVPANALANDMDAAVITATVQGQATLSDTVTLTSTADAVYGVSASGTGLLMELPGATITHTVTITNEGNTADTFDLTLNTPVWTTTLGQTSVALNAGESTTVAVTVVVPANAADGDADSVVVTATSQGDNSQTAEVTLESEAGVFYAVAITGTGTLTGEVGTTVTHTVTITNNGNGTDMLNLSAGTAVWATVLGQSSVTLAAGESATVTVTVTIPANAADGEMDAVVVSVSSQGDGAQTAATTLTTIAQFTPPPVTNPTIYLPLIMRP